MCSFIVSNRGLRPFANMYSKRRGPDRTNIVQIGKFYFVHNLLSITGTCRVQPFSKDGVYCVYNGEIYNYKDFGDYGSDGDCILDLYRQCGVEFFKLLDGEYSIVIVDTVKDVLILATDVFATKPLWWGRAKKGIGVASYKSSLLRLGFSNPIRVKANTVTVRSLKNLKCVKKFSVFDFDLRQHNKSYDRWIEAFIRSISKRSADVTKRSFLGLSSGYDSGAISWELHRQCVDCKAYTILGDENQSVVFGRQALLRDAEVIQLTEAEFYRQKAVLKKRCEPFKVHDYDIFLDKASVGLSCICRRARAENRIIYFSGQGADEIISDYGYQGEAIFSHSHFGGLFPADLSTVFPYKNFYGGSQIKYLAKEEHVAGSYGIEARYPFLDPLLVQEFLWLTAKLKNRKYKAPIYEYLTVHGVPFQEGAKIGFRANRSLVR